MAIDPERQTRVKEALREHSLDALVCASPSDVLLLSGYWPVVSLSIAILTAEGSCTLVLPHDETELAHGASAARLVPYSPASLDKLTTAEEQLKLSLSKLLESERLTTAKIGVASSMQMQPASYASSAQFHCSLSTLLRDVAPHVDLHDSTSVLKHLKSVTTRVELSAIRRSAQIASAGFHELAKLIQPGATENEVAALAHSHFESSSKVQGAQRFYGFFFCMSGPNSANASAAYARTQSRSIKEGDLVLVHANTCADGYWTDITRTYTAGRPSERHAQIRSAISEAREAAFKSIRPGVPARDVDSAARRVMQRHGMGSAFRHSTGHGVGFAAIDGNALPRIHPASPDILAEGMVFNVEPAAYWDDYGGMRHCDMVVVTGDGVECLTEFP